MSQNSRMRPQPNARSIVIPISWDVKKQDKKNWVMTNTLAVIIALVILIFTVGVLFSSRSIFGKLLLVIIPTVIYIYIYRFFVYKETRIRKTYEDLMENDYDVTSSDWWQIYHISPNSPHVCHFVNGSKGVFLKMKKDVIQGKEPTVEYDHYNAIADTENYISNQRLKFVYMDYMDNVGNDERMERLLTNTNLSNNSVLESMLLNIYSNLEVIMQQEFSSFDVVLIHERIGEDELKNKIRNVAELYEEANYKSVVPMNESEIRVLAKELFNLDKFSVVQAKRESVSIKTTEIIRPIQLLYSNGTVETLNPTFEEERLEKEEQIRNNKKKIEKELPKEQVVNFDNRQGNFGKPDELLDLFDSGTSILEDTSLLTDDEVEMLTSVIDYDDMGSEFMDEDVRRRTPLSENEVENDSRGIIDIFETAEEHVDLTDLNVKTTHSGYSDSILDKPIVPQRTSNGTFKVSDLNEDGVNPYRTEDNQPVPRSKPVPKTPTFIEEGLNTTLSIFDMDVSDAEQPVSTNQEVKGEDTIDIFGSSDTPIRGTDSNEPKSEQDDDFSIFD